MRPPVFDVPPTGSGRPFSLGLPVPLDDRPLPPLAALPDATLAWERGGLRVRVRLSGREWREAHGDEDLWRHDSVELFLAARPGAGDLLQWVVAPGMDPETPEPRVKFYDHRHLPALKGLDATPVVRRTRTAEGCELDLLLPWAGLGLRPRLGRAPGFQLIVNRGRDGGSPACRLGFFPANTGGNSRLLHRLRLARRASPGINARLQAWLDLPKRRLELSGLALPGQAGREARITLRVSRRDRRIFAGRLRLERATGLARARFSLDLPPTDAEDGMPCELHVAGRPAEGLPRWRNRGALDARTLVISTAVAPAPEGVTLSWPEEPGTRLEVSSRAPGGRTWRRRALARGRWTDDTLPRGAVREYAVRAASGPRRTDYLLAGLDLPPHEERGAVLLLVEEGLARNRDLRPRIARLEEDLAGDGWRVLRRDVGASWKPPRVKDLVRRSRRAAPGLNTVFLLGHLPVPYSGNLVPDGHLDNHRGAWPADAWYGDLDGAWTDTRARTGPGQPERIANRPGDGRFDQSRIPGRVRLAVGRVDFHDLPAFRRPAAALYAQYLDRDHAWRHGRTRLPARGLVCDNFTGYHEGFAASGWQNFTTLLGRSAVRAGAWREAHARPWLWLYGCGGGGYDRMAGAGTTADLARRPLRAVFTMVFGSYFGDWDTTGNYMRSVLAARGNALVTAWAGRPHWWFHPMALGATTGACAVLTQNNGGKDYAPAGAHARGVHVALLGDPTLRLHVEPPPRAVRAAGAAGGGVRISWRTARRGVRHLVYRLDPGGGYARLTPEPLAATSFLDPAGDARTAYLVKALRLQRTPTGSYWNLSQGIRAVAR